MDRHLTRDVSSVSTTTITGSGDPSQSGVIDPAILNAAGQSAADSQPAADPQAATDPSSVAAKLKGSYRHKLAHPTRKTRKRKRKGTTAAPNNEPSTTESTETAEISGDAGNAETVEEEDLTSDWDPLAHEANIRSAWDYFMLFSNISIDGTVAELLPGLAGSDPRFKLIRQKMMENMRHFQNRMLDYLIAHVKQIRNIDADPQTGSRILEECVGDKSITAFYLKKFSKENFQTVFYFMKHLLDFDNLSARGLWYCETVYSILCLRAHYHVNSLAMDVRHFYTDTRKEMSKFVKGMILASKEFDKVVRADFKDLPPRVKISRIKELSPEELPKEGDRFSILRPCPD